MNLKIKTGAGLAQFEVRPAPVCLSDLPVRQVLFKLVQTFYKVKGDFLTHFYNTQAQYHLPTAPYNI